MAREEKIKVIYKEMANKELTPWCCVEVKAQNEYGDFTYRLCRWDERPEEEIKEVIWHPVMIWDVISYLRKPFNTFIEGMPVGRNWEVDSYIKNINSLLTEWIDTRSPIEKQSDECINFVYNLILDS